MYLRKAITVTNGNSTHDIASFETFYVRDDEIMIIRLGVILTFSVASFYCKFEVITLLID